MNNSLHQFFKFYGPIYLLCLSCTSLAPLSQEEPYLAHIQPYQGQCALPPQKPSNLTDTSGITPARRSLAITPAGGMANRMRAITSGIELARSSNRQLIIVWKTDEPGSVEHPFASMLSYPGLLVVDAKTAAAIRKKFRDKDFFYFQPDGNKQNLPATVEAELYGSRPVVSLSLWEFAFSSRTNKSDVYDHTLRFSPSAEVKVSYKEKIYSVAEFFRDNLARKKIVGVHLRTWGQYVGDTLQYDLESPKLEDFVVEMNKALKADPDVYFFLAADDPHFAEKITDIFKERIIRIDPPAGGISRASLQGQQHGVAEWFLLGCTDYIIGTRHSSYSDLARFFTNKKTKISVGPEDLDFTRRDGR